MASDRPFPPSARRRALARAAGLSGASPIVVATVAWLGGLVAFLVLGNAMAARLGAWIASACASASAEPAMPSLGVVVSDVLALVAPVLIAAAVGAIAAHVAQTRGIWLPRRTVRGAPAIEPARARDGAIALAGGVAIGGVTLAWLWAFAPRLALLVEHPAAGALMIVAFVGSLAAVWVVIGAIDALVRHADVSRALRMTAAEKREDDRLAGADPRWRARRAEIARGRTSVRDAVAGASVVLVGEPSAEAMSAVAVAWDAGRRPVPVRVASGVGPRALQIVALARRHRVPVHGDPDLARALAGGDGPVPEAQWSRLAEIIAAVRRNDAPAG